MFYSPFKHPLYRAIWIVLLFSNIGTWMHTVTSSLLMAKLTTSATLIALVQTSSMLPIFMFAIPAGVFADLYDRKTIVLYAQILMSLLAFTMAITSYLGGMSPVMLLIMTFLLNIGFAFNQPAWQALSSTLIPPDDIKQAAALNNLSFNLSRCIGPAIAGYYFSTLGPSFLYFLNGLSFLGVIGVFQFKIKTGTEVKTKLSVPDLVKGFKEAFLFFEKFPNLKFIVTKAFLYFLLASSLWATLPYIVIVYQHMSDKDLGMLTAAAGIGAVLNAYYIHKLRKFLSDSQLTTLALFLAGSSIFFFMRVTSFQLYFLLMLIFGFSWSLAVSVFNGVLQSEFPKHTRSRLIGFYSFFFAAAQALGSYVCGRSIQLIGLNDTLFNVALITLFTGVCYLVVSNRGIRLSKYFIK